MKRTQVADLKPQVQLEDTFLVASKERKVARTGSAYLDLELQDSTGIIRAKLWDCDRCNLDFEVDDVVWVEGGVEDFQGTLQVRIRSIARWTGPVSLIDYLPRTQLDPEEMFARLLDRLRQMPAGSLRTLLLAIMEDGAIAEKYKLAPAATSLHHAYLGGLLEHVVSLIALGDRVCDHYPSLRRDLLLAGLVLHDLGKIDEIQFSRGFHYTTRGQLVGHIAIALEIVREKIRALPEFPTQLKDQIEHIILSHHGRLEFGSPKEPMFPEALVVHYLDDLDSKLQSMRSTYEAERARAGDWTSRNPALRRELLKLGPEQPEEILPHDPQRNLASR